MRRTRARGKHKNAAPSRYEHLTDRRVTAFEIPAKTADIYDAKSSLRERRTGLEVAQAAPSGESPAAS